MFDLLRERVHREELLDQGSGSERDVARSLADLRRVNRWLGGRRLLRRLLDGEVRRAGLRAFSLLDVGTGSADLAAAVRRWYPASFVVGCDRQLRHLRLSRPGDRKHVELVCGDVFRSPFPPRAFDFVVAALFAHHFNDRDLPVLLGEMGRLARRALIVSDLDRHWLPLAFMHAAAPVFARSPITQYDSNASIRRAFKAGELEQAARQAGFRQFRAAWHWFRRSLVIQL